MPRYLVTEVVEEFIEAHCEGCARDAFLTSAPHTAVKVIERDIELADGEEPIDAHEAQSGGF